MAPLPPHSQSLSPSRSEHDFGWLADADRTTLLQTLTVVQQDLANLHCDIAYMKTLESKDNPVVREQRIIMEGDRDALAEKKWLILRLLDATD